MKRRPSTDLLDVRPSKRSVPQISSAKPRNALVQVLERYGALEAIVSNLCAQDLFALAQASKALFDIIAARPVSLKNLLGKLRCSGKGVQLRKEHHKNSPFFFAYDCTEYVQCGSDDQRRLVDTKPCVKCDISTCDECRIHCVYQSIYEASSDPGDPAELPNFSGFVFLEPAEQPILSPHHLLTDATPNSAFWENPSINGTGPYHDQGHLDVALEEDSTAPPEFIKDLLNLNLGLHSLTTLSASSFYDSPSPVVRSMCRVSEARKVYLCEGCFKNDATSGPQSLKHPITTATWLNNTTFGKPISRCQCTLRKRFLDRWLCIGCYQKEDDIIRECAVAAPSQWTDQCRCGGEATHKMCLWCWGEIRDITPAEVVRMTP